MCPFRMTQRAPCALFLNAPCPFFRLRETLKVRLFADDTIAYLVIILPKDIVTLQEDLNELATWEDRWHMQFHANKWVVLTVSGKKVPIQADYKLHGQTLARVKSAKYLGVTLIEDLKWGTGFSGGRRILRPWMLKVCAGCIKMPRLASAGGKHFPRCTSENYHQPVVRFRRKSSVASWTN